MPSRDSCKDPKFMLEYKDLQKNQSRMAIFKRKNKTIPKEDPASGIERAQINVAENSKEYQRHISEKMTEKVRELLNGNPKAQSLIDLIEAKKEKGELNRSQLEQMDKALNSLNEITEKRKNKELSEDDYVKLLDSFTTKYADLILDQNEINLLQKQVEDRLDALEKNMKRISEAHETRNLSELEKLSLAFVRKETNGEAIKVEAKKLKEGAVYKVDFHDTDGNLNLYAHQNVRLGHIMTATGLTKVQVKRVNGFEGYAYLWPDGKTYTNPPWEKNKGNYIPIVSGDTFTVLKDSYKNTQNAAEENGVEKIIYENEIAARNAERKFETMKRNNESSALKEAEEILHGSYKVDIPLDVAKMKGADLETDLLAMDMGDYVVEICEQLADLEKSIASDKNGTALFIEIMERGNRKKISLKEITQVILGMNGKTFIEKYKEIKNETENLKKLEASIISAKAENKDMTADEFFSKEVAQLMNDNEQRKVLYKYENEIRKMFTESESGVIHRTPKIHTLFAEQSMNEKFLLGAHRLLKVVPLMKSANYVDTKIDRGIAKSDDLSQIAEPAIAAIFPPEQNAPLSRAGLWKNITRRVGKNASMGNMGEYIKYDEGQSYEQLFTSLYAYNQIRSKVTRIENGMEVVDLNKLAQELEKYRQQGYLLMNRKMQTNRRQSKDRIIYPNETINVESLKNMQELSPLTIQLIQHGMMIEQMKEYSKLKEKVINSFPKDIAAPLEAMNGRYEFSAEELQEIGENIKNAQIAMLHFTKNEVQHRNAKGRTPKNDKRRREVNGRDVNIGASKSFTIFEKDGNSINLSMGFNYNNRGDKAIPNSFEENFSFHLGPSYQKKFGTEERNEISAGVGFAGPFPGEMTWGSAGSLSIKHNWGEYQTWSSGIQMSIGAQTSAEHGFMENLALIHAGVNLIDINQENVVAQRASELYTESKVEIDRQLKIIDQRFDEISGDLDQLNARQKAQLKESLKEYFKRQMSFEALDDLSTLRFDKIGVEAIAFPPYFMLRIGVAIKGKTQMIYVKPDHFDTTEFADRDLAEKARQSGAEGYKVITVSGDLNITNQGERVYRRKGAETFDPYNDLEAASDYFMNKLGVKIERIENAGEFKLLPLQVDGLVEVYGDKNAGIYAYPGQDGEFYFSMPAGKSLAIQRHTHATPLPNGGVQEVTRIYITDNPNKNPEQIRHSNEKHVEAYVSQREGGRNSKAEMRLHMLAEEVIKNDQNILEWNYADVQKAQEKLDSVLGSRASGSIDSARFKEMENFVKNNSLRIKNAISIQKASLGANNEEYAKALLDTAKPLMEEFGIDEKNPIEVTAFLQLLLIEDRSDAPENPMAFIEHITNWNRASIEQSLKKAGVENYETIAGKISSYYGLKMRHALANGDFHLPESSVEQSTLVHTHIGGLPQGNVMEFLNGLQDSVNLEGAMTLTPDVMKANFKMTDQEVYDFLKALEGQMAPFDLDNPRLAFQNPIALQILESGAMIFGPKYAEALAEIGKEKITDKTSLSDEQIKAYTAFEDVMNQLGNQSGSGIRIASYGGRRIYIKVRMQVGYIHKCRNFTSTYKAERLSGFSGATTRSMDSVSANAAAKMYGAEAVGGIRNADRIHNQNQSEPVPEEETPPEDESSKSGQNALGENRSEITDGNFDGTGGSQNGANGTNSGNSGIFGRRRGGRRN